MSHEELQSVLCCPLKKPIGASKQQWGGYLNRGVAWVTLTAQRARKLSEKIRAIRELEEEEILSQGRWRETVPTFQVYELPEPGSQPDDRVFQEVMSVMQLRDTTSQGFARLRPSELPPGLPASSALNEGLMMDHPQQLAVDDGAVMWEVKVGQNCWYHTMAVQDWWLENIAQKHEVYTAQGEEQKVRFSKLAKQNPPLALEVLEGAGRVWRASGGDTNLLAGLKGKDLSPLLAHINRQGRDRLIRAIGQLPLDGSNLESQVPKGR